MRKEVGELRHEEFPRAEKVWTRYRDQKTNPTGRGSLVSLSTARGRPWDGLHLHPGQVPWKQVR